MITITGDTLNRAVIESFAKSASRLHQNESRLLRLRDFSIAIDAIRTNDEATAFLVSILKNDGSNVDIIDNKVFATTDKAEAFIMKVITDKYSLVGISLRSLKKAMDNIVDIKCYLYLREFFENGCDNQYKTRSINSYDFKYEPMNADNILSVTEAVLNDVREKAHDSFLKTATSDLSDVGLDYEDFEEEVFNAFKPEFPEWDVYGQHRNYMNEVDLPTICEKLLDDIYHLVIPESETMTFDVIAYDFSDHALSCNSYEELDLLGVLLDVYTVFEGEEELFSV